MNISARGLENKILSFSGNIFWRIFAVLFNGQSYEKVGEIRPWDLSLGSN
jgi:hypothetical protein